MDLPPLPVLLDFDPAGSLVLHTSLWVFGKPLLCLSVAGFSAGLLPPHPLSRHKTMEAINAKLNSQIVKLHREDGGEDRIHLFLDNQGFLVGAYGLGKLASWKKHPAASPISIPGLHKDAEGNVTVDPSAQKLFRFFSKETPCWFEGCKELREAYDTELEAALAVLEEDPNCSGCAKNKVKSKMINKYLAQVAVMQNASAPEHT